MTVPVLPDSQKIQKTVSELQEVCRQFDSLNFMLDQLIVQIDAEIQASPLAIYRQKKTRTKHSV